MQESKYWFPNLIAIDKNDLLQSDFRQKCFPDLNDVPALHKVQQTDQFARLKSWWGGVLMVLLYCECEGVFWAVCSLEDKKTPDLMEYPD